MASSKIPFVDLSRIHAELKPAILGRISSIIDRSAFVLGKEVEEFETAFAHAIGARHAVGVSNGLDALTLALRAIGVGPGDEVITAANTFIATAYAISAAGATPVLADVEPDTANLDPSGVERRITPRTRAILPVHLFGQAATMGPLLELARARGLAVLEDAAQAHGATYGARACGAMGRAGCFSFYPGKNLGSMGEGGAVVTDDDELDTRLRMLRNVGQREKNRHEAISGNYRMHTIQAAVLLEKLPHLKSYNERRRALARAYDLGLSSVGGIQRPRSRPDREHVYHLYVIATDDPARRDPLQMFLEARGIGTGIHYPVPIHLQPCYRELGRGPGSFPVSERLAASILSLPLFPGMTPDEVDQVCSAIREFFA